MFALKSRHSPGARGLRVPPALAALLLLLLAHAFLSAETASARRKRAKPRKEVPFRSALLLEANTGRVLRSHNPRLRVIPASIVKMMTILIALEHIKEGKIHLDDVIVSSRRASKIGGQQVYLKQGESFSLEELLKAVAISSANDAAYAIAEHVADDAKVFVDMMNRRARQLGMSDTRFINVNGLPPNRGEGPNLMSARDAGILARELLRHPRITRWSKTKTDTFRDGKFVLTNTNRLLGRFRGLDGLKTGYYREAGFSVVATAKRGNLRLIAVVFGSNRSKIRFREAKRMLAWGFSQYQWVNIGQKLPPRHRTVRVLKGQKGEVPLRPQGKLRALLRRGDEKRIAARAEVPDTVTAPVKEGQSIGRIIYEIGGNKLGEVRLVASEPVKRLGFFQTFIRLQ